MGKEQDKSWGRSGRGERERRKEGPPAEATDATSTGGVAENGVERKEKSSSRNPPFTGSGNRMRRNEEQLGSQTDGITKKLKDLNVAENDQISKKIRRLSREDDSISYILQCRKIKECLLSRSNFGYIRRALSDLLSWLAAEIDHLPQKAANQAVIECLGAIGYVLENDYRRFLSWVFDYFPSLESEQLKIPYYQALYQMLILYEKNPCSLKVPRLLVPDLIKNVLDASEEGDDFAAFANALDVLIQTSKVDPYAFRENFSDVMDLMIGWSIVPSLRPRQLSVIHGYIKELAHVWKAKVDFTMSITEQILEDIGAYLEFIKSHEESSATEKKQNLLRLAALYAILDTVLHNRPRKGRTESSTTLCTEMLKHFSEEYFSRFLSVCLGMAAVLSDDEMTVEYVSQALHLVFSLPWTVLPDAKVTANLSLLLNFLTHSLSSSLVTCKDSSTVNSLRSFPLVVKRIGSNLPPEFVPSLFKSDDAPLKVLRRSPNPIIVSACLDVFVSLLSLKSIPVMQSTYSQLVDDLENGDHPTQMFALAALTPVANLRYSFIAMLALSPPIFKLLLTKATSIQDSRTKDQFQSGRAALALLFSHCQCHSHFVSSSSLFSSPMATAISSPSSSLLSFSPASEPLAPLRTPLGPTTPSSNEHQSANTSPGPDSMLKTATEGLLAEELKLLLALFKADSKMSPGPREEVLSLSLPWFMAVLSSLPKDPPAAHSEEFLALSAPFVPVLVSVAHELIGKDTDTASSSSSMLQCLDCILHLLSLQHECMNDSTTSMICRLCFTLLGDKDEGIRTMVAKVLGYVPFRILQATFKEQSMWQLSPSSTETMSTASRSIMARAVLFPSLDRRDFALLMDAWFFHPTNPQPDINRMIWTAPRSADPRAALRPPILEALLSRPSLASLWAAWQTAGFFVAAKLKTDLGKPSNAFSGISNAVNALPPLFKCQPRPSLFKRGKEVLLFVDALERVTYNAGSGTALALPSPNQVVQGFFHTNRHVTEGFLRQWREGLLTVALEIEDPAAGVWHGTKLLQGLREGQEALVETTVYRVAACYALLHETGSINGSDEIHGFAMWIKAKFGKEFDWLEAMEAQAAGNFESAIRLYHREIRQRVSRKQDQTEDWMWQRLSRQLGECHLRIGEYHDAQDWWERLSPSETNHLDHRFLSALSQFNEEGPLFLPPPAPVFVPFLTDNESRELPGEDFWSLQRWKSEACLELLRTCVQCTVPSNTALSSLKISESLFAFHPRRSSMMKLFWGRRLLRSSSLLEPDEVELCDSSDLILCLNWLDLQRRNDDARNVKPGLLRNLYQNLCLAGAKKARLDGNLRLAQRLLDRGTEREAHLPPTVRARFVREAVQLVLSGEGVSKDAFDSLPVLLDSILSCLRDASLPFDVLTPQGERTALEETAASLLLYARVARRAGDERVEHFITPEVTALCHKHQASNPPVPSLAHMDSVGLLLHTPVALAPSSSAAWAQWAEWCFSRGEEEVQRLKSGSASTPADAAHFLPASLPDAAREGIWHALTEHWARSLPTHSQDPVILSSLQSSILGHLSSSPDAAPCLRQLVLFWMRRREEALAFHLAATHAYFAFLKLKADESRSSFACVAATLRLHHLLVKHAGALQKEMEAGLADTPCGPWKAILPQLFSRLIHPQPFARLAITDLLSRIAVGESHLIVFPAVVGALGVEEGTATDLLSVDEGWRGVLGGGYQQAPPESNGPGAEGEGEMDGPPEEERSGEHERRGNEAHLMRNCLLSLLDSLKRKNREGMEEVQVLIRELRRISVLWEELWLGTLQQIHGEVSRRIKLLEEEYEKLKKNQSLSRDERDSLMRAKHRILFAPVLFALDQLASLTSAAPETRNERMFQERYNSWIQSALRSVREASSPLQPGACWSGFRSLEKSLVDRASRRGAALLRMEHISPVLYAMKGTSVVLPGRSNTLGVRSTSPVCIAGVENSVTILPTKTRPKKLAFVGHNGRRYHYLFKGLEDLHLDERAMQFLSILNTLFASEARRGQDPFRACHYSVTPLGPRSGLIQWVEGGTPLFGLYRRWYQRRFELKEGAILRPSEIFMRKLQPHLKGSNLSPESRKDWPAHILRSVLLELMSETPTDILANEIWAFSRDAQEWLRNTERYTRSTAVMSMVGYVLGLGDRHLDNLLVDLHSGEIIHIDYNVCFEKGLSLKIPENVPFRLTPNIVGAMGVSGLEGLFRRSCEVVMSLMREHAKTLLILLETLVYDPLVDWTPAAHQVSFASAAHGGRGLTEQVQRRQRLQRDLTWDMLAVRIKEIATGWAKNKELVSSLLPELRSSLSDLRSKVVRLKAVDDEKQARLKETLMLREAEYQPSHPLYTLPQRYSCFRHIKESILECKALIRRELQSAAELSNMHRVVLTASENVAAQIDGWLVTVPSNKFCVAPESMERILEYLQTSGQQHLVQQIQEREREIRILMSSETEAIQTAREQVGEFRRLLHVLPEDSLAMAQWEAHWYDAIIQDFSVQRCAKVRQEFEEIFGVNFDRYEKTETLLFHEARLLHLKTDISERIQLIVEEAPQRFRTRIPQERLSSTLQALGKFIRKGGQQASRATTAAILDTLMTLNQQVLKKELQARSGGAMGPVGFSLIRPGPGLYQSGSIRELCDLLSLVTETCCFLLQEGSPVGGLLMGGSDPKDPTGGEGGDGPQGATEAPEGPVASEGVGQGDSADVLDSRSLETQVQCERVKTSAVEGDDFLVMGTLGLVSHIKSLYEQLLDMVYKFSSVILPELMVCAWKHDPSLAACAVALASLGKGAESSGVGYIQDMIRSLESHLMKVMRDVEPPGIFECVSLIREDFQALLLSYQDPSVAQGKQQTDGTKHDSSASPTSAPSKVGLCLAALSALCDNVERNAQALITSVQSLGIPVNWRQLDVVQQAGPLQSPITNQRTSQILLDALFLKRILAMRQVIQGVSKCFCINANDDPGTLGSLLTPIQHLIADIAATFLIGLPTKLLAWVNVALLEHAGFDLTKVFNRMEAADTPFRLSTFASAAKHEWLSRGEMTATHVFQAASYLGEVHRILEQNIAHNSIHTEIVSLSPLQASLLHMQVSHQWCFRNHLQRVNFTGWIQPGYGQIVAHLRDTADQLSQRDSLIQSRADALVAVLSPVVQRLKWGAGANPEIQELLDLFQRESERALSQLRTVLSLKRRLAQTLLALVHLEAARSVREGANAGREGAVGHRGRSGHLFEILARVEALCLATPGTSGEKVEVSVEEDHLMTFKPLAEGEVITRPWILDCLSLLEASLNAADSEMKVQSANVETSKAKVMQLTSQVKGAVSLHHRLMWDVRGLLRALSKLDDCSAAQRYMQVYRTFCDNLSRILKVLSATLAAPHSSTTVLLPSSIEEAENTLETCVETIDEVYDGLIRLGEGGRGTAGQSKLKERSAQRKGSTTVGNDLAQMENFAPAEENTYAMSVWRRIEEKLTGRDPRRGEVLTVEKQVDLLISEARDVEKLCLLYEGWTSWV